MSLNQKTAKLYRRLRQEPNRWQGLFKSTHFDRLVRKHVEETKQKHSSLGTCPEQFIVSGIVAQALKSDSQRDFIDTLTKEGIWRTVCGFQKSLPDQSTFSRKWNNETYLFALEGVFAGLRQLVVMKQLPGELKYSPPILQALQHGYIRSSRMVRIFRFPRNGSTLPVEDTQVKTRKQNLGPSST